MTYPAPWLAPTLRPWTPGQYERYLLARNSRAEHALLVYWARYGVCEPEYEAFFTRLQARWRELPWQCRCDPPGSWEGYCTGHCHERGEEA